MMNFGNDYKATTFSNELFDYREYYDKIIPKHIPLEDMIFINKGYILRATQTPARLEVKKANGKNYIIDSVTNIQTIAAYIHSRKTGAKNPIRLNPSILIAVNDIVGKLRKRVTKKNISSLIEKNNIYVSKIVPMGVYMDKGVLFEDKIYKIRPEDMKRLGRAVLEKVDFIYDMLPNYGYINFEGQIKRVMVRI